MPLDSPQPLPQNQDNGFAQAAFEELQYVYKKDPANFARMYRDTKSDVDNAFFNEKILAESCQKLCLLDLAVANIKANSSDHEAAVVMFNDATTYLDKLKSLPGSSTTQEIKDIATKIKCKI